MKLKITFSENRSKFISVIIRTISLLIPLESVSILLNEDYSMWHDNLSKTRVVENNK